MSGETNGQLRLEVDRDDPPFSPDELKLIEKTEKAFTRSVKARLEIIRHFRTTAEPLDEVAKVKKGLKVGGGATAILGGAFTITAGVLTIVTSGAAAPALIAGLGYCGIGAGLLGTGLRIGGDLHEKKAKESLNGLKNCIKEDNEASVSLRKKLTKLLDYAEKKEQDLDFKAKLKWRIWISGADSPSTTAQSGIDALIEKTDSILPFLVNAFESSSSIQELVKQLVTASCGQGAIITTKMFQNGEWAKRIKFGDNAANAANIYQSGMESGLKVAETIVKHSDKVGVGVGTVNPGANAGASAAMNAAKAATTFADDVAMASANLGSTAVTNLGINSGGKMMAEVAITGGKAGIQTTAETVAKVAGGNMAGEAAAFGTRIGSKTVVENFAKVAGTMAIGFSSVFVLWDVINIVKDSLEKSLGDTLREIAQVLENTVSEGETGATEGATG